MTFYETYEFIFANRASIYINKFQSYLTKSQLILSTQLKLVGRYKYSINTDKLEKSNF